MEEAPKTNDISRDTPIGRGMNGETLGISAIPSRVKISLMGESTQPANRLGDPIFLSAVRNLLHNLDADL